MKRKAKLVYGRKISTWAKLAKVSYGTMYSRINHGYDPRILIPRKSTCKNMIGIISTQASVSTRGLTKNRIQVVLDDEAMSCIETLQHFTGISDRSKLIAALAKAAVGAI